MMHTIVMETLLAGNLVNKSPPAADVANTAANTPIASRRVKLDGPNLSSCIATSMLADTRRYFVYHQSMHVIQDDDTAVSRIAAAIGEPARARMLFCLMDGHARTGTELAVVANVSP